MDLWCCCGDCDDEDGDGGSDDGDDCCEERCRHYRVRQIRWTCCLSLEMMDLQQQHLGTYLRISHCQRIREFRSIWFECQGSRVRARVEGRQCRGLEGLILESQDCYREHDRQSRECREIGVGGPEVVYEGTNAIGS